jgi:hypothetical protein
MNIKWAATCFLEELGEFDTFQMAFKAICDKIKNTKNFSTDILQSFFLESSITLVPR